MKTRLILLLFAALFIHGCTTANSYTPPSGDDAAVATIRGHHVRNGLFDWEAYRIESIDNGYISYIFSDPDNYKIRVTPTQHIFVVFTEFNRDLWGSCPCQAIIQIVASLDAGSKYKLNGKIDGVLVQVWIEHEETGQRVFPR